MASSNGHKLALHFNQPPRRVVSLVPSLTESMFDLGLGDAIVGVTDYCIHPEDSLAGIPRLGGPKNPRVSDILSINPDLVLANQEENTPQAVEELEASGVRVWVSFPQTVRQAMDVLWLMAGLFQSPTAAARIETLERSLTWSLSALEGITPRPYFCPIWQENTAKGTPWWMTFNRQTYADDVLRVAGGINVFGGRRRRYPLTADLGQAEEQDPGERDTRYPRVTIEEINIGAPEMILLPSEPYNFGKPHLDQICELLADTPAVRNRQVHLVDGSLITWHGTRLARAVMDLPALFSVAM